MDGVSGAPAAGRRQSAWYWLLAAALAAVLLYWSMRGVDWQRVWQVVSNARLGYIPVICGISSFAYLLRALRWRAMLAAARPMPVGTVFWANMAGYMANNFLPARAGELVRSAMISYDAGLGKMHVLTIALTERLLDAMFLLAWTPLVVWRMPATPAWMSGAATTAAAIATAAAAMMVVLPRLEPAARRITFWLPLPHGLKNRLVNLLAQVAAGVRTFHDPRRFIVFCAYTACIWLVDAVGTVMAAFALHLDMPFGAALLLLTGLGLGSSLPSTPGYVGIYQFVAVTVLAPFGFTRDDALAYILIAQGLGYLVITFWGVLGLWRFRLRRPAAAVVQEARENRA